MELKNYISENIISRLNEKGWSKEAISDKIKEFEQERRTMGFEGEALILSVKNRIKGYFAPILRSNNKSLKAVIFTLSDVVDENERIRKMSELKEGESGFKPDTSYVVKKGFYPWGNQQGKEIPYEPEYKQEGFLGIEYEKKFYYKNVQISGGWLIDKSLNKALSGDVIRISIDPSKLDNKMIYLQSYEYVEPLKEKTYLKLINENLKHFHKTTSEIVSSDHKGFTIVKGSVSDIEGGQYGYSFDIIDNVDNWDIENSLTANMQEVPFISGSENLIFIGEVFKKNKQPGYQMKVQKVIVPKKYRKRDLPKENLDIVEGTFDDISSINGQEIDEDLL
jgi:uncharacterized protein (UPF0335 family)